MSTLKLENSDKIVFVDEDKIGRLLLFKWYLCGRDKVKSFTVRRFINNNGITGTIHIANDVMNIHGVIYDHRDRNPLNNTELNLRVATVSQNNANKPKMYNGSSKYKGVDRHPRTRRWRARVSYHRRTLDLGYFNTENLAAHAYNEAALKYHGEFAVLNIITT